MQLLSIHFFQQNKQNKELVIATIFSYGANEEDPSGIPIEEELDCEGLDKTSRDFLDEAIKDYNKTFNTNFSTDGDRFQNYYKDLSLRVKNRESSYLHQQFLIIKNLILSTFNFCK